MEEGHSAHRPTLLLQAGNKPPVTTVPSRGETFASIYRQRIQGPVNYLNKLCLVTSLISTET